jgi:hypothetical protein
MEDQIWLLTNFDWMSFNCIIFSSILIVNYKLLSFKKIYMNKLERRLKQEAKYKKRLKNHVTTEIINNITRSYR